MPWSDYMKYLVVALELKEYDDFKFWVLAGQDPKKFKWAVPKTGEEIGEKLVQWAKKKAQRGDVWDYAEAREIPLVYQIDTDDGVIYVDENGDRVKKPSGFFVPTKDKRAKEKKWGIWI